LSRAPFRFSGRLLGLALNALAKVRECGDTDEAQETQVTHKFPKCTPFVF